MVLLLFIFFCYLLLYNICSCMTLLTFLYYCNRGALQKVTDNIKLWTLLDKNTGPLIRLPHLTRLKWECAHIWCVSWYNLKILWYYVRAFGQWRNILSLSRCLYLTLDLITIGYCIMCNIPYWTLDLHKMMPFLNMEHVI